MVEGSLYGSLQIDYALVPLNTIPVRGLTCQEVQLKGELSD